MVAAIVLGGKFALRIHRARQIHHPQITSVSSSSPLRLRSVMRRRLAWSVSLALSCYGLRVARHADPNPDGKAEQILRLFPGAFVPGCSWRRKFPHHGCPVHKDQILHQVLLEMSTTPGTEVCMPVGHFILCDTIFNFGSPYKSFCR